MERLTSKDQRRRLEALAYRYGDWGACDRASHPGARRASVIIAGASRVPFGRFVMISSLANLGISVIYAVAGAAATEGGFLPALVAATLLPLGVRFIQARVVRGARRYSR